MTLDEAKNSDLAFLTPAQAAGIIGCDPNYLRAGAHQRPEMLGFPVTVIGTRVRIPRKPFLAFIGEEGGDE